MLNKLGLLAQLRSGPNYLAWLGLSPDVGAAPSFNVIPLGSDWMRPKPRACRGTVNDSRLDRQRDRGTLADSEQQVERRRNKMQETLVRFLKRLNDAIQKIFSFCYDIGDAFGKDLLPAEYISEGSVQNHRHVWTDMLELAGRIDSVHARHGHVENNQVGPDSR